MSMKPPFSAGALVSNVLDLVKWHQALEAGTLLSAESHAKIVQPTRLDGDAEKTHPYGYGGHLVEHDGHRKIGHGGGIYGFRTTIARYVDDRLAVIFLANTAGADVSRVERRIAAVMLGIDETTIAERIGRRLREPLVGIYRLDKNRYMTVELRADALHATWPENEPFALAWKEGTTFRVADRPGVELTFEVKDGQAWSVTVHAGVLVLKLPRDDGDAPD